MKLTAAVFVGLCLLAVGCASQETGELGKPAQPAGTPPPSASDLPPALPPGKTHGPGRVP
jgi:hypothetical protein